MTHLLNYSHLGIPLPERTDPVVVVIILLVVAGAIVFSLIWRRRQKAQLLRDIRLYWGLPRPPSDEKEFEKIGLYHRLKTRAAGDCLDDKTWVDLNLDQVFEFIDRTSSRVGQQYLYDLLRTPKFEEEPLLKLERLVSRFKDDKLREEVQVELQRLNQKDALFLPYLFQEELPRLRVHRYFLLALTLAAVASLVGAFFMSGFRAIFIFLVITNMLVSLRYRRQLDAFIQGFRLLNVLINTSRTIASKCGGFNIPEIETLQNEATNLSGVARKTAFLTTNSQHDDLVQFIYQYLNMSFLLDVNCFAFTVEELRKKRNSVNSLFEALGYIDAAISIASLRYGNVKYVAPKFYDRVKICRFSRLYHPLLESPVANDLLVNAKGILITGSNMSGKSTFIRTVGANVILAQTIHTCFAEEYIAPFLAVKASMGAKDSLTESKSHYLAEVESVRVLVESVKSGRQCLFLLDELFRGTNTVERVAAAKAILEYLNRGDHIVIVATHDIELAGLLGDRYEYHHFREMILHQQMDFDYRIQPGTSSTRNAIAILNLLGYPKTIIDEALDVVSKDDKPVTKRSWWNF
jgi:DNA mismatch repair ATPase MutS